ncbi:Ribosomal protein S6 kinase alpha-5 [Zootermopsis nevadensis]|uniref:Ribosomal protein S6 kinase alpha-5 n=1 Tax=Zootermopsis nevadensis TaxID=136037 RepID=A0A067QHD7_ZOONE|nr:Ribosomal protein S6 kinase alpha-5 [Zootermopsis nevadensis]
MENEIRSQKFVAKKHEDTLRAQMEVNKKSNLQTSKQSREIRNINAIRQLTKKLSKGGVLRKRKVTPFLRTKRIAGNEKQRRTGNISIDDFERLMVLRKGEREPDYPNLHGQIGSSSTKTFFPHSDPCYRGSLWQTMTECRVSAEVGDSPFLVKSHYTFQTESDLHLVMDFLNGGDLHDLLDHEQKLPEDDVKFYTSKIVLGIEHLHKPPRTGKTFLAEAIAAEAEDSKFFCIRSSDLTSNSVAHSDTLVTGLFEDARQHRPSVIFFNEPPRTGKTFLAEAIAAEAEDSKFFCIRSSDLTSNSVAHSDTLVTGLFEDARQHRPSVIFFNEQENPDEQCDNSKRHRVPVPLKLGTGAKNPRSHKSDWIVEKYIEAGNKDIRTGLRQPGKHTQTSRSRRDLQPENIILDSVGHIVLSDFGLSKDFSSEQKPPRTGKTFLAEAIAAEAEDSKFFCIRSSDLTSNSVAHSDTLVTGLFEDARQHRPSVIFFNEVYSTRGKVKPQWYSSKKIPMNSVIIQNGTKSRCPLNWARVLRIPDHTSRIGLLKNTLKLATRTYERG